MARRRGSRGRRRPVGSAHRLQVVVSSVASDSHTWNLVYVEAVLRELGHEVRNLGPCVPDRMLRRECRRQLPDLVVISTVNGHGFTEGRRLAAGLRRCRRLGRTPIVIGGKLTTCGREPADLAPALLASGFSAVFGDGEIEHFRSYIALLASGAAT